MTQKDSPVDLSSKTAIVTGGSRGIGKAISLALAEAGANIVVAARTEDDASSLPGDIHKTVAEIKRRGGTAIPVRCDVTQAEEVQTMADIAASTFGAIDILVNNAGIFKMVNFQETTLADFITTWQVNVLGPFLCTQAVLPGMVARKSGSIISISSGLAELSYAVFNVYSASKAALNRMMINLAAEVAEDNIAVNVLSPAGIRSEGMIAIATEEMLSQMPPPSLLGPPTVWLAAQDARRFSGRIVPPEKFGTDWP